MQYLSIKDKKIRASAAKLEWKRRLFNLISKNDSLGPRVRLSALILNTELSRWKTRVQSWNRCLETGRARAVFKKMGVSRHVFRDLARKGQLSGISNAVW